MSHLGGGIWLCHRAAFSYLNPPTRRTLAGSEFDARIDLLEARQACREAREAMLGVHRYAHLIAKLDAVLQGPMTHTISDAIAEDRRRRDSETPHREIVVRIVPGNGAPAFTITQPMRRHDDSRERTLRLLRAQYPSAKSVEVLDHTGGTPCPPS